MNPKKRRGFMLSCLLWGGLSAASLASASPLSFDSALEIAKERAPELAADRASIQSAEELVGPADALPDPRLLLGVANLPISGPDAGSFNSSSMTASTVGISQAIPHRAKREARIALATASVGNAEAQRHLTRLALQQDVAQAWLERYHLDRKLNELDALDQENRILRQTVSALVASGEAQPADRVRAKQAQAALADRRNDLEAQRLEANASLYRHLDQATPVLAGAPPVYPLNPDTLRQNLAHTPAMQALNAQSRTMQARVEDANAQTKPDLALAVTYQQRPERFGDMVSAQVSFDLPVFSASRQAPVIRARQAALEGVAHERDALLQTQRRALDSQLAEHKRLSEQIQRVTNTWLPLATQAVALETGAYREGRRGLSSVLAARRDVIDQRMRLIDLEQQRDILAAQIHLAYGEPTS